MTYVEYQCTTFDLPRINILLFINILCYGFPEYGGLGLDYSYSIAVIEELGNINCGAIPMCIGVQTDMATPALTRYIVHMK